MIIVAYTVLIIGVGTQQRLKATTSHRVVKRNIEQTYKVGMR